MELIIKNWLKSILVSVLILFSSQNMAASVSDAVRASKNNYNSEAVKLWSQLANKGNTISQYNLANHYSTGSGVQKDKNAANKWLKNATRSGLIQAYLNLNKKAIASAKGMTLSFNVDPAYWLTKQEPNQYTIQLASSRNKKSIQKSYDENNIKGDGGYYHYVREGVDRYALIYGTYKTVAEANVAIKELPQNLRNKTPWVRKIKSLQKISK
jgi:septal ring-binding cell division protein DamX